jgi:hypothetical protein
MTPVQVERRSSFQFVPGTLPTDGIDWLPVSLAAMLQLFSLPPKVRYSCDEACEGEVA